MDQKAFNILKSRYAKVYNRLCRQHVYEHVVNRVFLKQIEMGILPKEFLICFHMKHTEKDKIKQARSRFRTNYPLKNRVLKRDNSQCKKCGSDVLLEIDHIIPIHIRPELALDMANLRVLCRNCHKKRHRAYPLA